GGGRASLTFLTPPSALVGGGLAAFVAGRIISLGSLVGLLTVLGIAARNGILLISRFQHLERFEGCSTCSSSRRCTCASAARAGPRGRNRRRQPRARRACGTRPSGGP